MHRSREPLSTGPFHGIKSTYLSIDIQLGASNEHISIAKYLDKQHKFGITQVTKYKSNADQEVTQPSSIVNYEVDQQMVLLCHGYVVETTGETPYLETQSVVMYHGIGPSQNQIDDTKLVFY